MKANVEIVIGFLGSGKTSFINSMLKREKPQNETIVVIQDEFGNCEIQDNLNNQNQVVVIRVDKNKEIDENYITEIISKHAPNRIFIEINGMKDSTKVINIFNTKKIKSICRIDNIINTIDTTSFNMYFRNMKSIISTHIFNSETIILNNVVKLDKKELLSIQKEIENINETADILKHVYITDGGISNKKEYVTTTRHGFSFFNTFLYSGFVLFLFIFLITMSTLNIKISSAYLDRFKKFYDVFISILIQGFPFILIGSFVSSIIQICISRDTFIKLFSKNSFLSCVIAAFAGLLFPICDCGTIPVVKGLMKKNVPIAAGITFMLAAPIVNPIAIIATLYAFPGMVSVVIYRLAAGILISVLVGLIMQFTTKNDEEILKNNSDIDACDCGFCDGNQDYSKNKLQKVKAIFVHAGDEFFNIGKYMIIGTFLSSIFQSMAFIGSNTYISNDSRISLLVMILLSFLLSVCSTSDAFVAKGFLRTFPISSILGFLVVGPMLDVKNTLMLFGSFKNKFVLKLIFTIILVSFGILINCKLT
ncbi:permease [Clostridium beijerinckii]|uniref:permease n=1 Tax=Clostridium beijerinckii TaxID=1520 RepID=UPI001494A48B|nr:permease [Clostridium beijerinckii]NOW06422.1 hypothetical protein [Clostridium beijerinckii]NRT37417.1 hypothetical protein [Clostridium beijerinckii]NRT48841.1 hypothetical protein [Clostridium beijerinckii]NRZ22862.1 hypothetical protein [Clostridium beijerinckii]NYC00434.1 uncharacterized membrane protein YraQ (UPF0718 family) [Clostridium beijerinckii]